MKTLGERLKDLRKEKGYTLEQVAEKLNTTKVTISRYENNLREPKRETISQLAKLFNVSTDYILGRTENKATPDTTSTFESLLVENYSSLKELRNLNLDEKQLSQA